MTAVRDSAERRMRQLEAVAELRGDALAGMAVDELLDRTTAAAVLGLGADQSAVLELLPGGDQLLVRAESGRAPGMVEPGTLRPAERGMPAGYVLHADGVVISDDVGNDPRWKASPVLEAAGVRGFIARRIGSTEHPFGVIGAHSRTPGAFDGEQKWFLEALADTVAVAVERTRAEALVRDSEARFRELADTTPALMWTSDADGRLTFINESWLRYTGRSLDEGWSDSFGESAHPDDRPRLFERWRQALATRSELRVEYRLRRADGEYRWVLGVGHPRYSSGEFIGYVGVATDIHERKLAEQRARERESLFRDVADTAPVMIWTTDTAGAVTFINRRWLDFTGTTLEEELGQSWDLGVHPDDVDGVMRTWAAALEAREPWEREYRLRRANGEYRWIVDRGVPRYEGDRFVGYVGSATDIHRRRLMEDRLRVVYEREHRVAETLQRSLLPERLPEIDGLELAARYLPAGPGAAVGGDWYDALELSDGRVALAVGDVVGHGLRAAAIMGQLRNALRAYALVETAPAKIVARLGRLLGTGDSEATATVLLAVVDRDRGEVTYTSAGHPPPLLLSGGEASFLEDGRSVPVGATEPALFREGRAVLPEDSTLVLYTDGLVERRDVALDARLEQLASVTAGAARDGLEPLCDRLLSGMLSAERPLDDVALLAVRRLAVTEETLRLDVPAAPEAVPGLRRRLTRFLGAAGASDHESYEITLAISEAAGNAIEHAYGPSDASFEVSAELDDGTVRASVRDYGRWREPRGVNRGRGLQIMEAMMDDVDVEPRQDGTMVRMRRALAAPIAR